jgi:hypothetical protein
MFNPEFRYILVQEQHNGEMLPLVPPYVISALFVCITNLVSVCSVVWFVYKLFGYSGSAAKYIWTALWNSLTPGNELLDLAIIISTIISGIVMIFALKGMGDVLDNGFTKLKDEINKKDERIRELEAKIASLEAVSTSAEPNINKNLCSKETEEEEAKRLGKWFSRSEMMMMT